MFLIDTRLKKCVTNLFQRMVECWILFLIKIRLKKCVVKLLIIMLMHENLFLIHVRLKKMCNKAVNTYPSAIQFDLLLNAIRLKKRKIKLVILIFCT